jgi:L-malate glycosyltransferase
MLVRELGPGGSERQLTEVAKGLDRKLFSPHVAFFREGFRSKELVDASVPCIQLRVKSFFKAGTIGEALRLFRYLRSRDIQLVHTFDYPLTCFAVPVSRAARVPVILSSQRSDRSLIPKRFLQMTRWTDRLVDGVVVNCYAIEQHLTRSEGVPPAKIFRISNTIDLSRFNPGLRDFDKTCKSGAPITIGSVAMFRTEKRLDLLIEAFAKIVATLPSVNLVLVGTGPEEQRLKRLAEKCGVSNRCQFEPPQGHVEKWFRQIDIFVLPSSSEALSNSLMEAMACGCAVIASNVGGNPELVTDGLNGLLFPSGDLESLTDKICRLVVDKHLRQQVSSNSVAMVRKRFSAQSAIDSISSIYNSLLARNVHP